MFRKLKRRFKPGGVILMYHRVANLSSDFYSLAVSPDHFAQHLEYIRRACYPMSLIDLADAVQEHSLPNRAVAITFDDGYSDNFSQARPLLQAAQIPATVYVSSDYIDSSREFWWDDLERILLTSTHLPGHLRISIQGQNYEWPTTSTKQRELACRNLHQLLQPLPTIERNSLLAELAHWAGLEQAGRPDYRAMTSAELIELGQNGLIDIGGHTVTHPVLSSLAPDEQYAEIVNGRKRLEELLGEPVRTFTYPFGTAQDFTDETVEIVKTAGFQAACTTVQGCVEAGDDLFRLQRYAVNNWDIEAFKYYLEAFFIEKE
jgi:peptidoglycan/xylan/chitin deacetylase (PgdA/CDA1 family)